MAVFKSFRLLSDSGLPTRHETFKDKDYLVVPVVALVQGVLWPVNSPTKDLVLEEEFARAPQGWNGRPVFCGHPQRDGEPVLGNQPEVLEDEQIGIIFNTAVVKHKLTMEAWLETARCAEIGGDAQNTYERAEAGEPVEISVGVIVTAEEESGEYQGDEYEAVWRDLVPDHLALLPEGDVGACSINMGCGVRTAQQHPRYRIADSGFTEETPMPAPAKKPKTLTERTGVRPSMSQQLTQSLRAALTGMSDTQVREELYEALAEKEPSYAWIEAVYDDEVVYSVFPATGDIEYYARGYTLDEPNRKATISDTRRQVEPVLTYPSVDAEEATATTGEAKTAKSPFQRLHDHAHQRGATCITTAAAAERPPCGCGGGHAPTTAETSIKGDDMDKKARVKALIESPHNPFTTDDAAYLESASDERLTTLEANDKATKETAEKAAAPPPAPPVEEEDETELTEEQFLQRAPQSIKSAMSRLQKQDAEHKAKVVKTLVGAQKEYNEQELNAMPIESLERMVRVCKAAVPEPDYSGRGTVRDDTQTETVPAPPNMQERILAARGKSPASAAK